jgi:adhesin transport system outer membrane protein
MQASVCASSTESDAARDMCALAPKFDDRQGPVAADEKPTGSISPATARGDDVKAESAASRIALVQPASPRASVPSEIESVAPDLTGTIPTNARKLTAPPPEDNVKPRRQTGQLGLDEAVAIAVLSHPAMGAQAAKTQSVQADIRAAQSAQKPQLEMSSGLGPATLGSYEVRPRAFGTINAPGTARSDLTLTFRQLVYDFGAAESEVRRNKALADSERLKLADQAEDIALRTVNAYLNLLEQSELLSLIDNTVAKQRKLANLVNLIQKNGNGTKADVDRIKAKVIETEAMRADINTAYHIALDEFRRLTNLEPKRVTRPKSPAKSLPKNAEEAIAAAKLTNPSLLAINATGVSFSHALDELNAQKKPRIDVQGDGLMRTYYGSRAASFGTIDARAMMTVSYKLMDGGLLKAQADRIVANQKANEFKALDEQETIELNLRRFFQTLSANRLKRSAALRGISTAESVNDLYIQQFKEGHRTIFEVLDSNMVVFNMRKVSISGEYEELRAIYGILRNMGRLVSTIAHGGAAR